MNPNNWTDVFFRRKHVRIRKFLHIIFTANIIFNVNQVISTSSRSSSSSNSQVSNIKFHKGYNSHIDPDLSCDFENTNKKSKNQQFCSFKQEKTDDADWIKEIVDSETLISFSSLSHNIGEVARLYGTKIQKKESHCVKFRYKIVSEDSENSNNKNKRQLINPNNFGTIAGSSVQLSVFVVEDTDWAYQNPIWSSSEPNIDNNFETVELSLVPDRYHLVFEARVLSETSPYKIYLDDIRVEHRRCGRAPHFLRLASLEMNRGQSGAFSCKLIDQDLNKYLPNNKQVSAISSSSNSKNRSKLALRLEMAGGGKFIRPDSLPMTLDYETIEARFSFSEATNQISGRYRCVVKENDVSAISNFASLSVKTPPSPLFAPIVLVSGATHMTLALNTAKYRGDGPIISTNLQYKPVEGKWIDTHPILLSSESGVSDRLVRSLQLANNDVGAGYASQNRTTYKLWNLLPDTEYEFRVLLARPYTGGQGSPGPTLRTHTKCDIPAESIKNIQSQTLGPNKISLVWDKPDTFATRCSSYTYEVRYRPSSSNSSFKKMPVVNSDQLGVELNNLTPYVEYELYVYIINSAGERQSDPIFVKTDESTPGIIASNSFKAKKDLSGEKLILSWTKPSIANGELKRYQIAYEPTETWIEHITPSFLYQVETKEIASDQEMAVLDRLYPGTLYKIKIRAATKKGYGPPTSISVRTSVGPPRMPTYLSTSKNKPSSPVIEVKPKGRVLLALHAAESNGAPIDRYHVVVEIVGKNKKQKRSIGNTGEVSSCPHNTDIRYGEHSMLNYWTVAEITQREFLVNNKVVKFLLGDNTTKFGYYNPSLPLGKFNIWFYSITKKMNKNIDGRPVENCLKLASVEITDSQNLLPSVTAMYHAMPGSIDDKTPAWVRHNQGIGLGSMTNSKGQKDHGSRLSLSSILILAVLLALFLLTVFVMYAVFVQRKKNHQNGSEGDSKEKERLTNSNNMSFNGPGLGPNAAHQLDSETLKYQQSTERLNNFPPNKMQQNSFQKKIDPDYHINTTITSQASNSFDLKMFPDGRVEQLQNMLQARSQSESNKQGVIPNPMTSSAIHTTQTSGLNSSINAYELNRRGDLSINISEHGRSQDSSPFSGQPKPNDGGISSANHGSPPGYDDSGYPASLTRKGIKAETLDMITRTPTPKMSNQMLINAVSGSSNMKINGHGSGMQTNITSGIGSTTGFVTPPHFGADTINSNGSSKNMNNKSNNKSLTNTNTSIRVEDFPIAVNQMKSSTLGNGFATDFNSITNFEGGTFDAANRLENSSKNRDELALPFDHSRVRLKGTATGVLTSDYINASYVEGFKLPVYYIATQSPLEKTVIDFWDMVWHDNARVIVMLSKLIENNNKKCAIYWPTYTGTPTMFGHIIVTLISIEHIANYSIRTFKVKHSTMVDDERIVTQFQLTSWPDQGVPNRATAILEFMRRVKNLTPEKYPTIVHCSNGIGRTGCFISLDMALDMAREEGLIDIRGLVEGLRSRRPKMVENIQQYEWLHDAALEAVLCGDTCVNGTDLTNHYDHLITFDPICGQAPIVEEFETLVIMTPKLNINHHCTISQISLNKPKNRFADVLPADCHLPRLISLENNNNNSNKQKNNPINPEQLNTDYINATLCDSYKRPGELIITQTPLPETTIDFWRLVWDYSVYSLIMVDDLGEHDESCQIYWPRGSVHSNTNTQNRNHNIRNNVNSSHMNDEASNSHNSNSHNSHSNTNSNHTTDNNNKNNRDINKLDINNLQFQRADTPISSCTTNTNAAETSIRFGPFEIELLSKDDEIDLAVRTFRVTRHSSAMNGTLDSNAESLNSARNHFKGGSESRIIKHFQLLAWPPKNSVPTSRNSTLRIISLIQKWRSQVSNLTQHSAMSPIDGPEMASPRMLVHCIAGAGRSGTFGCCFNVVEQLIAEKSADIFSQALKLRSHRPQLIESLDQYRFVYEVAGTFVDDTFDNTNSK